MGSQGEVAYPGVGSVKLRRGSMRPRSKGYAGVSGKPNAKRRYLGVRTTLKRFGRRRRRA